ncbi:hypothetical protein ASG30_03195 [Ramlibacter sp. Leaf400]|nr:hypothetical protein ASG30_03195 [Ramlibacter sp. Leaf400]
MSRKPQAAETSPPSSLLNSTRPPPLAADRKSERTARREQLYAVVRDAMVNAGVLSSGYRFKVLSLDGRGRQFLVMVDLTGAPGGDTAALARIETAMAQAAKSRHDIVVKAVYWREAPAAGGARVAPAPSATATAAPQPTRSGPTGATAPRAGTKPTQAEADPLLAQELAAFKQALATGGADRPRARAFDGAAVQGPQSYTLLTGFEDTELRPPGLSTSQHGDLR